MNEYETFIGAVRKAGNGSLEITIPYRLVDFVGLKDGEIVKIMIKKIEVKK